MRNPSDHFLRTINKDFDTVSINLVQVVYLQLAFKNHFFIISAYLVMKKLFVYGHIIYRKKSKKLMEAKLLRKLLIFLSRHFNHQSSAIKSKIEFLRYVKWYTSIPISLCVQLICKRLMLTTYKPYMFYFRVLVMTCVCQEELI